VHHLTGAQQRTCGTCCQHCRQISALEKTDIARFASLGALLVRKQAAAALRKVYFGGASVDWCTAEDAWHVLSALPAGEWD
jgi:hypothetical protein